MSRSSNDSAYSSWGKRKSLFGLSALTQANDEAGGGAANPRTIRKHRQRPSLLTDLDSFGNSVGSDEIKSAPPPSHSPRPHVRRPSLTTRGSGKRPPSSLFGSSRASMRTSNDLNDSFDEPLSSTSTKAPSLGFGDAVTETSSHSRVVLMHGEVQTSAGMFRKKKEYLVLSESAITRYKSQAKAAENFNTLSNGIGRAPTIKHGQVPSVGSQSDLQTASDSSGEKSGRVPLHQVVAVHTLDDGKPYFALEVCYLDEESGQASAMTLQFNNPQERDLWQQKIRAAVDDIRLRDPYYIAPASLENAARLVERDNDYDPSNCAIFKVVQRQPTTKSTSRSSSEDLTKLASIVCFLAIGVHKIHIIPLLKPVTRSSSPSLAPNTSHTSYGILTLTSVKVSKSDDTFELILRQPLQRPRIFYLASSASREIAARLHCAENFLRPECSHRLVKFTVPAEVEDLLAPPASANVEEHSCLQRTLIAYCVAYGVNPANVRYSIDYECEDGPRFVLLPPADPRRPDYGPLDLLAIMRALRYNESFGSLSFAGVQLDCLNGLHDNYGREHVCTRTKHGTPIKLTPDQLSRCCLLVQEVRALAATSKKLRRMDFSACITASPSPHLSISVKEDEHARANDTGCGIVEALFPLCRHQTTNVDWICLNGIHLSDTDLDYLVGAAVEKACHLRAIELNRCGLTDRSLGLILDALRAQDNTLEAIEIAGNGARLEPATFDSQLSIFGFIRKLNLSDVSRTSGPEALLQAETLLIWRLSELRLSGTSLNPASVDAISTYLAHPQSDSLHALYIDNTQLSGGDIATLFYSMTRGSARPRSMHMDISQSHLAKDLDQVTQAIASNHAPSHLSMRAVEFREESSFRKLLAALTINKTIQYLDMSQTALPEDVSEEGCRALRQLMAENDTLVDLNLSGEDSRLASSMFGPGINDALKGLQSNKTLRIFHIEKQKLGMQGANSLAEVLQQNSTLRELYCDNNEIPLQGLTDLVNSLIENTTLVHLPTMDDGRAAAFKSAELTMKVMSEMEALPQPRTTNTLRPPPFTGNTSTSSVKRGLASVRRTAQRTASAYTPSFPNLPSYGRSSSSPDSRTSSPLSLTMPHSNFKQRLESPITATPVSFTVQDVQTTHRLLTEQWNRQCYRLAQYLERNWCLLNDMPATMEVEDEKFERPESVGSLGKMLAEVKYDTTPRAERELYFDRADGEADTDANELPVLKEKSSLSFKQFILEAGQSSPESDDITSDFLQLRLDRTAFDDLTEPHTPTQRTFAI